MEQNSLLAYHAEGLVEVTICLFAIHHASIMLQRLLLLLKVFSPSVDHEFYQF